ncbi:MAG: fumarate reductase/succinate dehydrogenase flavoprotein subunit [Chloroflexi bacterium 13_1_40CM_4_68_4]|nr:MAG: fumarate reductase/succinate dehydrogenase flavoprotein subunit [Chloroflexi bacterium 13_1_40CM_4_68_4]
MIEPFETRPHDVLVMGAGGAGLRAAIAAKEAGADVGLMCKSLLGKAHTVMAEGGIASSLANLDPQDGWQVHFADTMRGGKNLNNWRMVELFAKEAPDRVYELEHWGAVFDRTPEGKIMQRAFGGHTYRRLCHVGDRTGLELIRTLQDRAVALGIPVYMEVTATTLFTDGDRIAGAFGYFRKDGRFVMFPAKAIVLATGGWGKLYQYTSMSWESTGDGAALAYRAGAVLQDMEMLQFHPTGMLWPPGVRGLLVTEGVRGEGGILKNSKGERFMERIDPVRKDLATRDVVARAIATEVAEGRGSPHGGVFLDITHRGADFIKRKLPNMYDQFESLANVDITKEPMEVYPTNHYTMGGVRVDAETGSSTLDGLFAAGEVACGLHGANRLGGNSLSDLLVFGKRAGDAAAAFAKERAAGKVPESAVADEQRRVCEPFSREEGENPYALHRELQETMQQNVGIFRVESELRTALNDVLTLQRRVKNVRASGSQVYNPGWHAGFDVQNMLTLAEAIVRSAIERKESRGGHWRTDYPQTDPEYGSKNFITTRKDGTMKISTLPIPPIPRELAALLAEGSPTREVRQKT